MAKTIVIDSLTKYISKISKMESACYFRGESKKNPSRIASAFRNYDQKWRSRNPFPFMKMIAEFYNEVAYKLNEDRIDFIAFAQHHGIPTNLLDISSSPLTALYFACDGDADEEGVVYMMREAHIDITDLIHKYPDKNLIETVFSNTPKELELLIPLFEQFKSSYGDEFEHLLKILIADYLAYFDYPFLDEEKELQKELIKKDIDVWTCISLIGNLETDLLSFSLDGCDEKVYLYLSLQYHFLKQTRNCQEAIFRIRFLPNMIYRPVIKFERGRNQQGLFIYQGYQSYIEPIYSFRVLTVQDVYFQDVEFRIKNKRTILKELDKIGINRKTLFCDYDSIAKYIVDKFREVKKEDILN